MNNSGSGKIKLKGISNRRGEDRNSGDKNNQMNKTENYRQIVTSDQLSLTTFFMKKQQDSSHYSPLHKAKFSQGNNQNKSLLPYLSQNVNSNSQNQSMAPSQVLNQNIQQNSSQVQKKEILELGGVPHSNIILNPYHQSQPSSQLNLYQQNQHQQIYQQQLGRNNKIFSDHVASDNEQQPKIKVSQHSNRGDSSEKNKKQNTGSLTTKKDNYNFIGSKDKQYKKQAQSLQNQAKIQAILDQYPSHIFNSNNFQSQQHQQPSQQYAARSQTICGINPSYPIQQQNIFQNTKMKAFNLKNNQIVFSINHCQASIPSGKDISHKINESNIFLIAKKINYKNGQGDLVQNNSGYYQSVNYQKNNSQITSQNQSGAQNIVLQDLLKETNSQTKQVGQNQEGRFQENNQQQEYLFQQKWEQNEQKRFQFDSKNNLNDSLTYRNMREAFLRDQKQAFQKEAQDQFQQQQIQGGKMSQEVSRNNSNIKRIINHNQAIIFQNQLNSQNQASQLQNIQQLNQIQQSNQQLNQLVLNKLRSNLHNSQQIQGPESIYLQSLQLLQMQQLNHVFGQSNNQEKIYNQVQTSPVKKKKESSLTVQYDNCYKYICSLGNNGQVVKQVLDTREYWKEMGANQSNFNFKWVCSSNSIRFDRMTTAQKPNHNNIKQCVNFFEGHKEISSKSGLIKNMKIYAETNKIFLFDITPNTFILELNEESCEFQLRKFASYFLKNHPSQKENPSKDTTIKKSIQELKKRLKPIMNTVTFEKSQKSSPYSKPRNHPSFISKEGKYLWLLKPTGLNRGRGIQIFSDLETFEKYLFEFVQDKPEITEAEKCILIKQQQQLQQQLQQQQNNVLNDGNSSDEEQQVKGGEIYNPIIKSYSFVIQKYVERPLLIKSRKFDIRVWVLVNHNMDVFFFKRGYIRTSCEAYNIDSTDLYVHLTNNAVQRFADKYGEYEDGNMMTFDEFDELMVQEGLREQCDFFGRILPQIKDYCFMNMQSIRKKLNSEERKNCFQIFGYDYLIDEDFKLWLIECNCNPCLEQTSPYLKMLIPRMLDDAFKLTIDLLFPKKQIIINSKNVNNSKTNPTENQDEQLNKNKNLENKNVIQEEENENEQNHKKENFLEEKEIENEFNHKNNKNHIQIQNQNFQQNNLNNILVEQPEITFEDFSKKEDPLIDEKLNSINKMYAQEYQAFINIEIQNQNINQNKIENKKPQEEVNTNKIYQTQNKPKQHFPVTGFSDSENMWDSLGSLLKSYQSPLTKRFNSKNNEEKTNKTNQIISIINTNNNTTNQADNSPQKN